MPKSSFRGENERACGGEPPVALVLRKPSQEPHVWGGGRLDAPALRPVSDDHQPMLGKTREGLHDQVDPLVGHQLGNGHVVIAARLEGRRGRNGDGRVDDRRLAIVATQNAIGDVPGYGDEVVDARARRAIPRAKARQDRPGQHAPQTPIKPRLSQVLLAQIPRVTHGREAIADMDLTSMRHDTLGDGVRARYDQFVRGKIERLDRAREKG